jgi:hypothetical protein
MEWGERNGWIAALAAQGALLAGLGALVSAFLLWKGFAIRKWQNMPIDGEH